MMICTAEVQEKCPYSFMCGVDCKVADDSECADFITAVLTGRVKKLPGGADPVEDAYIRQEREAIREETLPDFMRKYIGKSYQ